MRARIGIHPIHSMLVHFPSALFPMSLLFDLISLCLKNQCLACAAFYCIAAGLCLGFAAMCAGAIDYSNLSSTHPAWNKASLHALLNVTWFILFGIVFGLKLKYFPVIQLPNLTEIIISSVSVAGLIFSNYLGGDLVFRYKIGFDEKNQDKCK